MKTENKFNKEGFLLNKTLINHYVLNNFDFQLFNYEILNDNPIVLFKIITLFTGITVSLVDGKIKLVSVIGDSIRVYFLSFIIPD